MQDVLRPQMVTINEAAARTGLSPYTVRKLCWQKRVVTLKTGNKWLINYDDDREKDRGNEAGDYWRGSRLREY